MARETSEQWPPDWSQLGLESLSLIVGWRTGSTRIATARVPTSGEVAEELRDVCSDTLQLLSNLDHRQWYPDAGQDSHEYLLASLSQLGEDSEVLRAVRETEWDVLGADTLPSRNLLFYALVAGPSNRRITFLRKYNPRRGLKRRLVALFTKDLTKIQDPLFSFDEFVDMVIDPENGVAILNLGAFELLFRSSPEMIAKIPEYVGDIASVLPMHADAMSTLAEIAERNNSVRRRLQAIVARGHLSSVTMSDIRSELSQNDLDPDRFVKNDQLTFDKAEAKDILKLLNEDLFRGGLSNEAFQVERKSPR